MEELERIEALETRKSHTFVDCHVRVRVDHSTRKLQNPGLLPLPLLILASALAAIMAKKSFPGRSPKLK
jgi:hypothetical protein